MVPHSYLAGASIIHLLETAAAWRTQNQHRKNVPWKVVEKWIVALHLAVTHEECCDNGHVMGCESLKLAHDIGDMIARNTLSRAPCVGCCPSGHRPEVLQADRDSTTNVSPRLTTAAAHRLLKGT
jgi:hypothetical protein